MKKDQNKIKLFENMKKINSDFIINEDMMGNSTALVAPVATQQVRQPSDVNTLANVTKTASSINSASKRIDSATEFSGAFQNWFGNLGYNPQKISKSKILMDITKVLNNLGYR